MSSQSRRATLGAHGALAYQDHVQRLVGAARQFSEKITATRLDSALISRYLQGERQAEFYIRNMGQIMVRPLGDEVAAVHEQLTDGFSYGLEGFTRSVSPSLFATIHQIRPNRPSRNDTKLLIEQRLYGVEMRRSLLRYVLTQINGRYGKTDFRDFKEASSWTTSFSRNLTLSQEVIAGTRALLQEQEQLFTLYFEEQAHKIGDIEQNARARLGVIQVIQWRLELTALEQQVINRLAAHSAALEETAFQEPRPTSMSPTSGRGRVTTRTVGMYLMGLAGLAGGLGSISAHSASAEAAPQSGSQQPDPAQSARMSSLLTGVSQRLGQTVRSISDSYVASDSSQSVPLAVRSSDQKIARFFTELPHTIGRQTLVISSQAELQALVDILSQQGYEPHEVLTLLSLPSVDAYRHPLTIDIRAGSRMPILYTYDEAAHMTAPHPVISHKSPQQAPSPRDPAPATSEVRESQVVYRVQAGDRLSEIAARFGLTAEQIRAQNDLQGALLQEGQSLLLPSASVPSIDSSDVVSHGAITATTSDAADTATVSSAPTEVRRSASVERRTPERLSYNAVIDRYGDRLFPELDGMPAEARHYLLSTVEEIATFFDVRPGDLMGIMRAEQNNAGWRLQEPSVSVVGATGVAQIVPRTWNGWSSPEHDRFVSNVVEIENEGGLGFDWSKRAEWRRWQAGEDAAVLDGSNADPTIFENSVAGIARHLVHWGLTTDVAAQDPGYFGSRLADAIAVYNSGRTLDQSATFTQSAANHKTTAQYVAEAIEISEQVANRFQGIPPRDAGDDAPLLTVERQAEVVAHFRELYDSEFGIFLEAERAAETLDSVPQLMARVADGELDAQHAAALLLDAVEQGYIQEGRSAILSQGDRPWPFVHDGTSLSIQRTAVSQLGRTLTLNEMDELLYRSGGQQEAILTELEELAESRMFGQSKQLYKQLLKRRERELPIRNSEVATLLRAQLVNAGVEHPEHADVETVVSRVEAAITNSVEYRELQPVAEENVQPVSTGRFTAMPLNPMPATFKGFGVAVDYQAGGRHTGIDVANPREANGAEPPLFAVAEGTVVHVGPLYCDVANACRGGNAIVIDHGNEVYSLYSHNSVSNVSVGQSVVAGEQIGRQGNEGYSFGSHLHFEVHVGAPWSGNWAEPFQGGEFADPHEWLP